MGLKSSLSAANTEHGSPWCRKRTETPLSFPAFFPCSLELRTCNNKVTSQTIIMRQRDISPPSAEFATGGALATGSCLHGIPWARTAGRWRGRAAPALLTKHPQSTAFWKLISNSSLSRTPLNIFSGLFKKEATSRKTNKCPESALHDSKECINDSFLWTQPAYKHSPWK